MPSVVWQIITLLVCDGPHTAMCFDIVGQPCNRCKSHLNQMSRNSCSTVAFQFSPMFGIFIHMIIDQDSSANDQYDEKNKSGNNGNGSNASAGNGDRHQVVRGQRWQGESLVLEEAAVQLPDDCARLHPDRNLPPRRPLHHD